MKSNDLFTFYLDKEEPNKSCLLALRDAILNLDHNFSETRKYGMPCFCFNGKIVCYLWIDKVRDEPYILFAAGNYLDHPELESGNRKKMKIFRLNPTIDLPISTINSLLKQALDLCRNK
jgi:hypothetical protein